MRALLLALGLLAAAPLLADERHAHKWGDCEMVSCCRVPRRARQEGDRWYCPEPGLRCRRSCDCGAVVEVGACE